MGGRLGVPPPEIEVRMGKAAGKKLPGAAFGPAFVNITI
jgi:hypothetical protein